MQNQPYFHHGTPAAPAPAPASMLQSQTRYLCGAAYEDQFFVDQVISEVVEDEHRAVVPSYGFDLDPVVRHCLRARRLWLYQHIALTGLIFAGLCFAPGPTVAVLFVMFALTVPAGLRRRKSMSGTKIAVGVVAFLVVGYIVVVPLAALTAVGTVGMLAASPLDPAGLSSTLAGFVLRTAFVALALAVAIVWSRHTMLRTLTVDLAPGAPHRAPDVRSSRVERRLATVAAAQRGNVVMHAGYKPFLGFGETLQAWSIVVDLRPHHRQPDMMELPVEGPVDPVELNRHVKRRLAALRSETLPERERISGLTLRDQIVTAGTRWQNYPLIDPAGRLPYAYASQRAIEAIMRHPQASARHFLRATTGTAGKPVMAEPGVGILPAEDQEVQVSAFVHLAVEGGLLYVEFVSTVLGALKGRFHRIDDVPANPADLVGLAIRDGLVRLPSATLLAPVNLVRSLCQMAAVALRMNRAARSSAEAPVFGYGARNSIRELASSRSVDTYVQKLDAHKYSKLIEHRVNDAVLDYLHDQGVDISEYRQQMGVINQQSVFIAGNVQGNVGVAGGNATVQQATAAPAQ